MSLNLDWSVIEIHFDPVPGDPVGVRQCADKARSKASTVDSLRDDVSRIRSGHDNGSVFVGKAADRFISKLDDFPSNLSSLSTGLSTISQTLDSWSYCMEDCQHRAGNAYNRAVEAKNRASDANSKLDRALGDAANAGMALQVVKRTLGVVAMMRMCDGRSAVSMPPRGRWIPSAVSGMVRWIRMIEPVVMLSRLAASTITTPRSLPAG